MPLQSIFRLSFYMTLAMACACLAAAELFFLWWIGILLVIALSLIAFAYLNQERWLLGVTGANRLALVIALGVLGWMTLTLSDANNSLIAAIPWPAGLLPYMGPLLIVLLLVKIYRPKSIRDFWGIQLLGLMAVTLACVLAGDPYFGVLLVIYLACLLWSMAMYYQVRCQLATHGSDAGEPGLFQPGPASAHLRWLGVGQAFKYSVVILLLGQLLFVMAPRQGDSQWLPHKLSSSKEKLRTGVSGDIDLNATGRVELSEETAFEVTVHDRLGPLLNLDPTTRWYVKVLDQYYQGRWSTWSPPFMAPARMVAAPFPKAPLPGTVPPLPGMAKLEPLEVPGKDMPHPRKAPALSDSKAYFYFDVNVSKAGALVLAEPKPGDTIGLNAHLGGTPLRQSLFYRAPGSDAVLYFNPNRSRQYEYGHVSEIASPSIISAPLVSQTYVNALLRQPLPEKLAPWVQSLLKRLPDLTDQERELIKTGWVAAQHHAKVAAELCRYMADSGEFSYSLDLVRREIHQDPAIDFLLNVKTGNCERFACSLTLMLRSIGIPARVIKGFQGHHPAGEGTYHVRQSQAHSWVQALINTEGTGARAWLILDPTPAIQKSEEAASWSFAGLLSYLGDARALWQEYVLNFNAAHQMQSAGVLWETLRENGIGLLCALGLALGAVVLVRGLRRYLPRQSRPTRGLAGTQVAFYEEFLQLMWTRLRVRPMSQHTPLEFAQRIGATLHERLPALESLPGELVSLLYAVRFGGKVLTSADIEAAEQKIGALRQALVVN